MYARAAVCIAPSANCRELRGLPRRKNRSKILDQNMHAPVCSAAPVHMLIAPRPAFAGGGPPQAMWLTAFIAGNASPTVRLPPASTAKVDVSEETAPRTRPLR